MLLPLPGPLDGAFLLSYLASHRAPGVDEVTGSTYRRLLAVGPAVGLVSVDLSAVSPSAPRSEVTVTLAPALAPHAPAVLARVRRLLDADCPLAPVERDLRADLALDARWRPGLRLPGALDPFEAAARVILGQQVSMASATTLSGRLVARLGQHYPELPDSTARLFPSPARVAAARPDELVACGILASRARALIELASAIDGGYVDLEGDDDPERLVARLDALPGIGPWTASYITLRTRLARDVFLAGDLAVRRALGGVTEAQARQHAERWRPWRSHALLQLWYPYVCSS